MYFYDILIEFFLRISSLYLIWMACWAYIFREVLPHDLCTSTDQYSPFAE